MSSKDEASPTQGLHCSRQSRQSSHLLGPPGTTWDKSLASQTKHLHCRLLTREPCLRPATRDALVVDEEAGSFRLVPIIIAIGFLPVPALDEGAAVDPPASARMSSSLFSRLRERLCEASEHWSKTTPAEDLCFASASSCNLAILCTFNQINGHKDTIEVGKKWA